MKALPTTRAAQLATPQRDEETWLIEGLWSAQAVGIIGGEPKCGKEQAVSSLLRFGPVAAGL